jgi:hypothetical protein
MGLVVCLYLVVASGCGLVRSKHCCPVYLPHDHLLGSEAIRIPPCGPDGPFHGLSRTTWRQWPVQWQLWQPVGCPVTEPVELLPYTAPRNGTGPAKPLPDIEFQAEPAPVQPQRQVEPPAAEQPRRSVDPMELFKPDDSPPGQPPAAPGQEPNRREPTEPSDAIDPMDVFEPSEPPPTEPLKGVSQVPTRLQPIDANGPRPSTAAQLTSWPDVPNVDATGPLPPGRPPDNFPLGPTRLETVNAGNERHGHSNFVEPAAYRVADAESWPQATEDRFYPIPPVQRRSFMDVSSDVLRR